MPPFRKEFIFTCIIKNFFVCGKQSLLISKPFVAENIEQTLWSIGIDRSIYAERFICLRIDRYKTGHEEKAVTLDLEMELCISETEVVCLTCRKRGVKFGARSTYVFSNVLSIEEFNKKMKAASSDTLIVRCRMFATAESETAEGPLNLSCTHQTSLCLDELSYIRCVEYSDSPDWSSRLGFPMNETQKLDLNIKNHHDDILFDFNLPENKIVEVMKCEITLFDYEGNEKLSRFKYLIFFNNGVCHVPTFLKKTMLEERRSVLRLKFKFTFPHGTIGENVGETEQLSFPPSSKVFKNVPATNSVTDDLRKMLFSEDQQMAENETGVIPIQDMDVQTLKLFLEFAYTGELEDSDWERMLELLLAADKYQFPSLKEKCSRFLKQHISLDNVCDVVSVADMLGEQTLKVAAMDYVKENVAAVLSSSKWSLLTDKNVKLCSEIICYFSEKYKSNT